MDEVARVHELQRLEHAGRVVPQEFRLDGDVLREVEGEVGAADVLLEHVEVDAAVLLLVGYPLVPDDVGVPVQLVDGAELLEPNSIGKIMVGSLIK